MKSILTIWTLLVLSLSAVAEEGAIPIVAAQNFYGEVAEAIGGDRVSVESVVVSGDADPHDFEPPPSVARSVADAAIVVMNGGEYDHWMERLIEASDREGRIVVEVGGLIGAQDGDNPHFWYDPRAMVALADSLAEELTAIDPAGAEEYANRHKAFLASLEEVNQKVATIRDRHAGTAVTATEPVFGPMAAALGLDMQDEDFQRAIMNETEPSARQIAEFERKLKAGEVKALFYNLQVVDPLTEQLIAVAAEADVPVVGVTESMPPGSTYAEWMLDQLDATAKALEAPSS